MPLFVSVSTLLAMSTEPLLDRDVHTDSAQNGATRATPRQSGLRRLMNTLIAKVPSNGARVAESLDYEPVQNDLYLQHIKERRGTRHVYGCVDRQATSDTDTVQAIAPIPYQISIAF